MKVLRISWLAGLLAVLAVFPAAAQVELPAAKNLTELATDARDRGVPILLMFSAPDCGYCRALEADYLKPMIKSGDYDDKVIIRKVQMSIGADLVGFDGQSKAVDDFADRYKVFVTPTVLLVGPDGHQLASKLEGYSSPDFYGGYLDKAIDTSLGRLREMAVAANP